MTIVTARKVQKEARRTPTLNLSIRKVGTKTIKVVLRTMKSFSRKKRENEEGKRKSSEIRLQLYSLFQGMIFRNSWVTVSLKSRKISNLNIFCQGETFCT